ncbi:MAG: M16 family metallopeptidase [Bacteroidota bacterium]
MPSNRKLAPAVREINKVIIKPADCLTLPSGIKMYSVNDPSVDVLKIEFVFDAGARLQPSPYVASATNAMLVEGTTKYTSKELAENLDFFGAYLQNRSGSDDATLTLFCLPRHLESCLPFVVDILTNASYSEHELITQKENAIQRLMVNEGKTSYLARRSFYESVFGYNNPYGTPVYQQDINNISRETLVSYYENKYRAKLKYLMISGSVGGMVIDKLASALSGFTEQNQTKYVYATTQERAKKIAIHKDGSVQSTIRIGRKLFGRNHPDFRKMQLLNLVLGGYFGSRLMSNIREEKGLTYGIYSSLESYLYDGAFYIETDINNDLVELGVSEIYKELHLLSTQPIREEELNTAKSYMLGSFLRSLDGVFEQANRQRILIDYGLSAEYYEEFIEIIKNTNSLSLLELANKYLKQEDLYEVVAGK